MECDQYQRINAWTHVMQLLVPFMQVLFQIPNKKSMYLGNEKEGSSMENGLLIEDESMPELKQWSHPENLSICYDYNILNLALGTNDITIENYSTWN